MSLLISNTTLSEQRIVCSLYLTYRFEACQTCFFYQKQPSPPGKLISSRLHAVSKIFYLQSTNKLTIIFGHFKPIELILLNFIKTTSILGHTQSKVGQTLSLSFLLEKLIQKIVLKDLKDLFTRLCPLTKSCKKCTVFYLFLKWERFPLFVPRRS